VLCVCVRAYACVCVRACACVCVRVCACVWWGGGHAGLQVGILDCFVAAMIQVFVFCVWKSGGGGHIYGHSELLNHGHDPGAYVQGVVACVRAC